jgi:hypothetical protein
MILLVSYGNLGRALDAICQGVGGGLTKGSERLELFFASVIFDESVSSSCFFDMTLSKIITLRPIYTRHLETPVLLPIKEPSDLETWGDGPLPLPLTYQILGL